MHGSVTKDLRFRRAWRSPIGFLLEEQEKVNRSYLLQLLRHLHVGTLDTMESTYSSFLSRALDYRPVGGAELSSIGSRSFLLST